MDERDRNVVERLRSYAIGQVGVGLMTAHQQEIYELVLIIDRLRRLAKALDKIEEVKNE